MEITLALLADAANISREGKLNILGCFGEVRAREFPARHPEMQLVLRIEASPAETGTKKSLQVKLMDADGGLVATRPSTDFTVPASPSPGARIRMQVIMRMIDVVFPKAGDYVLAILINENTEAEVPLSVLPPSPPEGV